MKCIKEQLDNGMIIALAPMKNVKLVTIGFFIKAGSRNETDDNHGIAHFLEHMMFAGTKNRTMHDMYYQLDNMGSEYNAVTTTEHTYYYVNGNADHAKRMLDIVLDIYINPIFNPAKIKTEGKVIIEELRMREDSTYTKIYNDLHRKMFKGTTLGRNIIGTERSITHLKKPDFIEFRNMYYIPKNTVFVIVGNFDPDQILPLIRKTLNKLTNPDLFPNTHFDEKPLILKQMQTQDIPYVHITRDPSIYQAYCLMAFPIYDLYKSNEYEIDIITHLLSTGFSSKLLTTLRVNHGITYTLDAYPITHADAGLFAIKIIVHPDELARSIKLILRELKKLKTMEIDQKDFKKVTNIIKNESVFATSDPLDMFTYYGLNFLHNKDFHPNIKQNIETMQKTSKRRIMDLAEKIFVRNKINLFMYGNIKETDYEFMTL